MDTIIVAQETAIGTPLVDGAADAPAPAPAAESAAPAAPAADATPPAPHGEKSKKSKRRRSRHSKGKNGAARKRRQPHEEPMEALYARIRTSAMQRLRTLSMYHGSVSLALEHVIMEAPIPKEGGPKHLQVHEVAQILGISVSALYKRIHTDYRLQSCQVARGKYSLEKLIEAKILTPEEAAKVKHAPMNGMNGDGTQPSTAVTNPQPQDAPVDPTPAPAPALTENPVAASAS
ncbi:MAG: hypothetical protein N3A02_00265 [Rectinema sp.]|nr:hypothetical protein [Rectinema sp.]